MTGAFSWNALCFLLALSGNVAADDCNTTQFDETLPLKQVIDGDTLLLQDGRFVRLIGLNSPELNHEKPPADPLAEDAKSFLTERLKKQSHIGLIYGKQSRDRYQRILAHTFLSDGTNLQSEMLKNGMGAHIFFPPNDRFYDCYERQQAEAIATRKGIWTHPRYQDHPADVLTLRHIGFYHVSGRVKKIHSNRSVTWLVITDRFSFRIANKDLKRFKKLKPETLLTHTIRVSGWIFPYGSGLNMRILDPKNIEILD